MFVTFPSWVLVCELINKAFSEERCWKRCCSRAAGPGPVSLTSRHSKGAVKWSAVGSNCTPSRCPGASAPHCDRRPGLALREKENKTGLLRCTLAGPQISSTCFPQASPFGCPWWQQQPAALGLIGGRGWGLAGPRRLLEQEECRARWQKSDSARRWCSLRFFV